MLDASDCYHGIFFTIVVGDRRSVHKRSKITSLNVNMAVLIEHQAKNVNMAVLVEHQAKTGWTSNSHIDGNGCPATSINKYNSIIRAFH